jgi:hypothetical protein
MSLVRRESVRRLTINRVEIREYRVERREKREEIIDNRVEIREL